MKIKMNKVTWYSKLIALAVFILFPFLGFILGMKYQRVLDFVAGLPPKTPHIGLQTSENVSQIQGVNLVIMPERPDQYAPYAK
jgi:hypothetical protein